MKKSLITLAVLGAFSAPAFASDAPVVYGQLDAAVVSLSNTGQHSQVLAVSGGLAPSLIGVKGAEQAGDVTVVYKAEFNLDSQDSTSVGLARQKLLGVAGDFGTVAAGYLQTAAYDFGVKFDPTADSSVSALQNMSAGAGALIGSAAAANRAQRALAYISNNYSGFSFAVNYATAFAGLGDAKVASSATSTNQTATLLALNYDKDSLAVGFVYASLADSTGANNGEKDWALGASYDFGAAKVFATYQNSKADAPAVTTANKVMSLSGVIPAGPGALVLTFANANMATANTNGTAYTAAYIHPMSKTTSVYGAWSHVGNGSAGNGFSVDNNALVSSTASAGASSNLLAIGLKKTF